MKLGLFWIASVVVILMVLKMETVSGLRCNICRPMQADCSNPTTETCASPDDKCMTVKQAKGKIGMMSCYPGNVGCQNSGEGGVCFCDSDNCNSSSLRLPSLVTLFAGGAVAILAITNLI